VIKLGSGEGGACVSDIALSSEVSFRWGNGGVKTNGVRGWVMDGQDRLCTGVRCW